ncbi:MAG: class I SAM-dependent methyltransferase [Anaerolineae bacterium]|nr:MAG: class I SAM-dependent methyltransferase [Anaerolineae bacterium]
MGRKSWSFDLRYLQGRSPWDTEVTPPEVVELIEGLPPGRALDLGCGTGTNCIYLARHGWEVVGVDFSVVAIRRAQRKARQAGVDCQFYRGDVTDLAFLAHPFDLALDIGCLHSLSPEGWGRYAAEVARLVRPGGLYLLYAFTPRTDRPIPRGVTPEEVLSLFTPTFAVEREERGEDPSGPRSAWYWLRRLYPPPA